MMWERRLYRFLTDAHETDRACESIPESACVEVPRSFVLNVLNGTCTKLAEQLASPSLVLTWLLSALGAPVALIGWLEPIRQGGSMLPQLAVAAQIRARPVRKWFWVGAGAVQAVLMAGIALVAILLQGTAAGVAVLVLLALFSMASGVGSVAFSDVVGKTIPKGKRGQLLAVRASAGGALTLVAGLALRMGGGEHAFTTVYAVLIGAAAALWAAAAFLFAAIAEPKGATGGGRNALATLRDAGGLLSRAAGFRRYLIVRALLMPAELAVPFYVLHARQLGLGARDLGIAIVAVGVANLVSSPLWGRIADRVSSRRVMLIGALTSAAATASALLVGSFAPDRTIAVIYAPVFVLAGLALAGIRLGRKTYLIDATEDSSRPLYVSLSNTIIGVLTFVLGALGIIGQVAGLSVLLAVLLAVAFIAALAARWLPEADRMADQATAEDAS